MVHSGNRPNNTMTMSIHTQTFSTEAAWLAPSAYRCLPESVGRNDAVPALARRDAR
jgi:hypothetical protein